MYEQFSLIPGGSPAPAAQEDFARFGYTLISRHDSIAGEIVAYYGPEQEVRHDG